MSVAQPPLPPRRSIPPPPPLRSSTHTEVKEDEIPKGIAARIASLQLGQVGRTEPLLAKPPPVPTRRLSTPKPKPVFPEDGKHSNGKPVGSGAPPPIPPKWTRPSPDVLARALARRPPPPPVKRPSVHKLQNNPSPPPAPPDAGPRRRIPPIPARLPTPPPDPQSEFYEQAQDTTPGAPFRYDEQNSCLECRDFSHVDAHAALFPRHTVASLDNLAYDLTEPFPYEIEKARAIFTWLHHNIAYDADAFFSGNIQPSTAESTLSSGLAVCDGYSGLFKSLAERVGIQAHKVVGHGKGVGYEATGPGQPVPQYSSGHAWNCAFLDGNWHLIDACWGAGALDGSTYQQRFAPMWFTSPPVEFGKTHFPEDPSYQLASDEDGGPVSWEAYIMEPAGPVIFVDFYKLDLWPSALQPPSRYIQGGTRASFQVFKRCEHMSTAEADNFVFMVSFGNERVPLELNEGGGWSADVNIPRDAGEVSLYNVTTVSGRDAKGFGIQALKRALGRQGMTFGGLARWTVI
ncbi:hypothetical protein DXG03_003087 [Asterophora parasitica]|uniref:Transglutaminase-like domain-containing protein n=1 Tax=Asterophora parasitica TaxID=117018 RepID=A0A9P7KDW1_9AGAR|nr:hypothetical protein DXG03_003087 [Asterophora parasitica]